MTGVRLKMVVAYNGTDFHGWQIQPDRRTVQGVLHNTCRQLLGRDCSIVGAGRTDAGVHARGQVCHLTVDDEAEAERIAIALPRMAPDDILVSDVTRVAPDFSARFDAIGRRYCYYMHFQKDIFAEPMSYLALRELDRRKMDRAAGDILGRHDFTSFCKTRSLKDDGNECDVELCHFQWEARSAIFEIRANRFLHNMVRSLVGTLLEIGRGTRPVDDIPVVLAARDRSRVGRTAPARGLFLEEVYYPESDSIDVEPE